MSRATMSAPSSASLTACARPWPRAAPVINATLPSSLPTAYLLVPWLGSRTAADGGTPCPLASVGPTRTGCKGRQSGARLCHRCLPSSGRRVPLSGRLGGRALDPASARWFGRGPRVHPEPSRVDCKNFRLLRTFATGPSPSAGSPSTTCPVRARTSLRSRRPGPCGSPRRRPRLRRLKTGTSLG